METGPQALIAKAASAVWWIVLLKGILAVIIGIMFFSNPRATLVVIMMFLGAYWLVDGIFTLIASFYGKKEHKRWGWGMFVAILSILAGIAVFAQPIAAALFTTKFLVYFMGFMILASGISSVATGIKLRKTSGEWMMIFGGVFAILLSLLLLFNPIFSATFFVFLLGIFAVIDGVSLIAVSFRIRKLGKSYTE
ncbi:MAG: HdeD family acid-resistance protein [Candidatus Scalindua sp. AMX11]|nr:MAG: HdeD family acid-resistance protein [Candidatus Scalindua sp.]NOG84791.1 HdeD family acid-resistance protein [Planctomycetota bacterium]RZV98392.1 MAG: HdeD family acid-resistance protein [Candidatus Scalindua sp. SCAELEC01]TDE66512.1 MAG: HdeD family acid-resistance protein [Candidatus Scalindua sp. AMX11]GJQ58875.1 MAG: membrane protein [Candidatus Scalindua sp.]